MAEIGRPGTLVVTVWSYSKSSTISDAEVCENAIWGVLFDGVSDDTERRIKGKTALVEEGYDSNKEYFDKFFKDGTYLQYCNVAINGFVEQGNVIKMKKEYKIGKIANINYQALRKRLEDDNIIRGLSSGF